MHMRVSRCGMPWCTCGSQTVALGIDAPFPCLKLEYFVPGCICQAHWSMGFWGSSCLYVSSHLRSPAMTDVLITIPSTVWALGIQAQVLRSEQQAPYLIRSFSPRMQFGWPGTFCEDQVDLELTRSTCLCLQSTRIKGMHCSAQLSTQY